MKQIPKATPDDKCRRLSDQEIKDLREEIREASRQMKEYLQNKRRNADVGKE
ncbi:hypothetical protein DC914_RS15530 [Vibrio parahaemolyticus]|uniref:hypothetical protein n=1 Tax=Vibrio parahaemolyticus TaxID=670 RepID=UPI000AFF81B3|nr:hypothetical protein [Vibrio parahaemolyticus]EGQ8961503.1 hypothetical protein [Vibrio parahaemolyticus]EJG0179438.1 hypothetical protein [Vibrio parahaemolyticus]EJG0659458.1 hypothetical protein [Vibrio parahaemolyticus]EJM9299077.1 hypothetical protein [Vibrio parahaemolyticus]HAS6593430.1 hypothetical protein [Vibrio parahaemolyticus]